MLRYDPFARGRFPVGVRTTTLADDPARPLHVESWYPATDAHAGQDVTEATRDTYELLRGFPPIPQDAVRDAAARSGPFPLVVFSHGFGSHRRQSTFFCTHLASHGYVVASVDHAGNTLHDVMQVTLAKKRGQAPPDGTVQIRRFVDDRPRDAGRVLAHFADDAAVDDATRPCIDPTRIGMTGHSFGGWTTLMVTAADRRIRAAVALAPAGGRTPLGGDILRDALDFRWGRPVPTLVLAAARDSLLPLDGMRELFARVPAPKRLVVLQEADHMHFCDRAETVHEMFRIMPPPGGFAAVAKQTPPMSALCPPAHAYDLVRGLGLAHFDAHLRGDARAARFLADEAAPALVGRGIAVDAA